MFFQQALEIEQKKIQQSERKKKQEQILEEREKSEQEFRQLVNENLALSLDRATEVKTRKDQIQMLVRILLFQSVTLWEVLADRTKKKKKKKMHHLSNQSETLYGKWRNDCNAEED